MRRLYIVLMLLAFAPVGTARADDGAAIFYVQLIRGTDTDQPPVPGSKSVGPKLAETLIKAGMADIQKLANCSVEDLTTVQGVGEKTALKVIASAQAFLAQKAAAPEAAAETSETPAEPSEAPAEAGTEPAAQEQGAEGAPAAEAPQGETE